jgi:hypothetical protein
MRKVRIFVVELVFVALFVGWIVFKYPESIDTVIPWVLLIILWHITWEVCRDSEIIKTKAGVAKRKWGHMWWTWTIVFVVGGVLSTGYWYLIKAGLGALEHKYGKGHTQEIPKPEQAHTDQLKTPEPNHNVNTSLSTENPAQVATTSPNPAAIPHRSPPPKHTPEQLLESRPPADEVSRRRQLLERLRGEYILSHDNISAAMMAGTEELPADWVNKRLQELGEQWKVSERQQPPLTVPTTDRVLTRAQQETIAGMMEKYAGEKIMVMGPIEPREADMFCRYLATAFKKAKMDVELVTSNAFRNGVTIRYAEDKRAMADVISEAFYVAKVPGPISQIPGSTMGGYHVQIIVGPPNE